MANWKPSAKTAVSVPALTDLHAIEQDGVIYKETNAQILGLLASTSSQWILEGNTWAYSSADAPSYIFNVNADATGYLYVGQKIKYTQDGTTKYGIITAVGSYTSTTPITIYGGGNTSSPSYAMTSNPITNPHYSLVKNPMGFPINPDTWTYEITDTTSRNQSSPTLSQWYNLGSININIPIGLWNTSYKVLYGFDYNSTPGVMVVEVTLSSTTNSETDEEFTDRFGEMSNTVTGRLTKTVTNKKILNLGSKTTYSILTRLASGTATNIWNSNDYITLRLKAVCQYL